MKKITIFLSLLIIFACEDKKDDTPEMRTVTFINKTYKKLTITDNSGRSMFEDVIVLGHITKELTYECPSAGSCDIDYVYQWAGGSWRVCVCSEGYTYNLKYTFGFCPDNSGADAAELCTNCRNSACD